MFAPAIVMRSPQAAKNVRASDDALFEVFERLEAIFQRLEIYTEAALDQNMVDTVAKIMAEVLNILSITTNEIKQGRMSKPLLFKYMLPLTEPFSEKYLTKLFGSSDNGTEIEDALKRLDWLTQEEVQMAAAQVLKATHTVDDTGRVRGVADIALDVDSRVAGVSDQVQGVSNQIQGLDDKITAVMNGAQHLSYLSS